MEITPSEKTQVYVNRINSYLRSPALTDAEYRVVKGSAAVVLQRRLESIAAERAASKEYEDLYTTESDDPIYSRNLLVGLSTAQWSVPTFLGTLVEGQVTDQAASEFASASTPPDYLPAIKMQHD